MNLPNKITVTRIALTCVFLIFIFIDGFWPKVIAAAIYFFASVSDYADGYYAKKYDLSSDFGKLMDPIADKFLTLSGFFVFAQLYIIEFWMFWIIAAREILITLWRLAELKKGNVMSADWLGKYKTLSQLIATGVILLFLILKETKGSLHWSYQGVNNWFLCINIFMWVAVILTLTSGVMYVWDNRKIWYER